MPEIQVHMAEGRTLDQKRTLAKELTDVMVRTLGVHPDQILVEFIEVPNTSKAKGGYLFADKPPTRPAGS